MPCERPITYVEREPLADHCGIIAAYSPQEVPFFVTGLAGLVKLQTRGYDGAGVFAFGPQGQVLSHKGEGMINEVFTSEIISKFKNQLASLWLFQTRYGTDGDTSLENIQPVIRQTADGDFFAIVHNGQFSQPAANGHSDTVRFAQELAADPSSTWDEKIINAQKKSTGAWSLAVATSDGLYLMRDTFGIRPLVFGSKINPDTNSLMYVAASETAALSAMGVNQFWEVAPGSVIKISQDGIKVLLQEESNPETQYPCIFENVYLENGKSVIHRARINEDLSRETTVEDFRRNCGLILAAEEKAGFAGSVDLAIGIPGTGIAGGKTYAAKLGIPYIQAITDRKPQEADARTFMIPNIDAIPEKISKHFYFERNYLEGMRLVLIDDSIVRGNITKGIIKLLKAPVELGGYGVSEIHIRILCPPIDKPCHLGINTRKRKELIAAGSDQEATGELTPEELSGFLAQKVEQIRQEIGADSLNYLSDKGMIDAAGGGQFCLGCMVGHLPPISKQGIIYDQGI